MTLGVSPLPGSRTTDDEMEVKALTTRALGEQAREPLGRAHHVGSRIAIVCPRNDDRHAAPPRSRHPLERRTRGVIFVIRGMKPLGIGESAGGIARIQYAVERGGGR